VSRAGVLAAGVLLVACHPTPPSSPSQSQLAGLEERYADLRYWSDQQGVTEARGANANMHGVSLTTIRERRAAAARQFVEALGKAPTHLSSGDSAALAVMRDAWASTLAPDSATRIEASNSSCDYSADSLAALPAGEDSLRARALACYARATESIVVDGDTLNRLAVLGTLGQTDDPARRERLFRALEPVWRSVNGDDTPSSPYRVLLRLRSGQWRADSSHSGETPIDLKVRAFAESAEQMEGWLTSVLEAWRASQPDSTIEPWDFYYLTGAADRRLSGRIPTIGDLSRVNQAYYRSLGADPDSLNVHFDLEVRQGKYPVAYTDFGARPAWDGHRWRPGEPWVFTQHAYGGFDNLAELLHETGHAIHIAAIRTRPAYLDWPDNDTFTEAIADVPALEVYEPAWQQRFLGDSAPLDVSSRAKYASIVFDVAWGLFEIRIYRDPSIDPNRLWTDITNRYLRIKPHPELSWWAMRAQLVDGPGYLVNYAIGALITADMRDRLRQERGSFSAGDSTWYRWMSEQVYRYGLEKSSQDVLRQFLGRPLTPDALLKDMRRMQTPR
jgi:hypothetical protein